MFKILSRSIPKSNRSLTKLSSIYKKIRCVCLINTSQRQRNGPKTHARNTDDNSERGAKKFEVTYKTSRTLSSSCVGKTGLKFLKKSLFPEKSKGKVKLLMYSTSSPKYFYSSTMNQTKESKKKFFKTHRALELYKKAFEQCMKIKFEKHRIDRANNKIGWTPKPFKKNYSQELVVISDEKNKEDIFKSKKIGEKFPKQVLRLIPKKSLTIKEMAQKRKVLKQKKLSSPKNKKKMKIVYPPHKIKHNLGLTTPYIDKSIRDKIEELSNIKNKSSKTSKSKAEINTVEVVPFKQELNQTLLKVISAIHKRREKLCQENAHQTDDAAKHLIGQHPTVKKATKAAKMSINKKYNVIMLKSQAKVQLKTLKPEEWVEEKVTIEEVPAERLKNRVPPVANKIASNEISETSIIERNQAGVGSKITQHPIRPSKVQTCPQEPVRYPKKILVDKTETFDIDGICLRTKESYVAYVDEFGKTLTKISSHPEIVYTNLLKQKEKSTPEHRKTNNLKPVQTQDNVLTKIKPDHIDTIKKIDNQIESRSSKEKNENLDVHQFDSQAENRLKTASATQSLLRYLKRLNELKDQTAVDRLSATNYPNRKSVMVEYLDGKKLFNGGKIPGEKADVKENETVIPANANEFRKVNVTKLEDSTGNDETRKIKDDRFVENKTKESTKLENATHKNSIEKLAVITCSKSLQNVMEDTNEIHPSEVKPLYEKLLKQNREQVSAEERKKFKPKMDKKVLKRKSEAKRKIITSNAIPITEPIPTKPQKKSKCLLEDYQPITENMAAEKRIIEEEKVTQKENKIFKKILQQYTLMSKTDTGIEDNQSTEDKQRTMKGSEREKVVPKNESDLENNFDSDFHVYQTKGPRNELKIHSIAVENQNYSGNDLTSSTDIFSKNIKPIDTKDESKYAEKLKNILEPASQYLEKLREAGENQMKSLGELKTQFKNQLAENIGKSLKKKQMLENNPRKNDDLNGDEVTKIPRYSDELKQEKDMKENELMPKNQLTSKVDIGSNDVENSPNEFVSDYINPRKENNILDENRRNALHAYQNMKTNDVTTEAKLTKISGQEYGSQKTVVQSLQNRHLLDKPSDKLSERNDGKVETTEHLSEINKGTIVKGNDLLRKEHELDKSFDESLLNNDVGEKETFLYILKEVDGENLPKIVKEKAEYNNIVGGTRNQSDLPEDFISTHHMGDKTNSENILQNRATSSSQDQQKYSPEKSLPSQESAVVEHSLSSNHLRHHNNYGKDPPLIKDEVFSQPIRNNKTSHSKNEEKTVLLNEDESDGGQVIEPSSEKNREVSHMYNSSQDFVLLHNRPTIRKKNPPPINPKTDNNKRDKSKTKKDLVLPPPKTGDTPKMVRSTSAVIENEKPGNQIWDEPAGKHSMKESKCIIGSQYRALESENRNSNPLHNYLDKVDLEDIVFGYRSKPKYDQNKLFKNWITILAFIEELKITYKDGSDANLIKMSEEMNFLDTKSDLGKLEYVKTIPIDSNEYKQTSPHQKIMTKNNAEKIKLSEVSPKSNQDFGKASVEKNTVIENITRIETGKAVSNDDHPTFPKNTIIEYSVFPNSPEKIENPASLNNNEVAMNCSNTKIEENSEDHQNQDIKNESTFSSKKTKTSNEPKFPKKIKWPPKIKKLKFPPSDKKSHSNSMRKSPNTLDQVSESKLSRKKIWMHRGSSEPKSSKARDKLESNKILNETGSVQPKVSNFLEDNLKNWKLMNNKSAGLIFRENTSDSLTKTKLLASKSESSLLKTFLLDEDEEIEVVKIHSEPNKYSEQSSLKTKECLNNYSKEKGHHLNIFVEKSGENAIKFKESKSLSLKSQVDTSPNLSKSEEGSKVSNNIFHSNSELPQKCTESEQHKVSNSLEENLKFWKLLKPNVLERTYAGDDKRLTDENNLLKPSRLLKMFSLDESEYPESIKHLKRTQTTIIPEWKKKSYQDQRTNLKSPSQYENTIIYDRKIEEIMGSNTPKNKIMSRLTAPKKKQEDRRYEEIHSKKTSQNLENSKTCCNSDVELIKPKKTPSRKPNTQTQHSSKPPLLKTYSLKRSSSRENAGKLKKKCETHAESIDELNKMEKTTDCFSLYFRNVEQLNRTGIKKVEGKPSITLTLPKINNGKLKQIDATSKEPLEKLSETENSGNYPKCMRITSMECSSSSSSRNNGDHQKGGSKNDFDGNNGDDNRKKDAPKLLIRVLLPKNRHGNKTEIEGIQLQDKEPDAQKEEKVPGKLKKEAIFKLSRTFGSSEKHRRTENKLDNILKVSKVSYDRNISRKILMGAKNSNVTENSRILSNKDKTSEKMAEGTRINLKNSELREMCSMVHLNWIMDKYRVNTDKLQDLDYQIVILNEVELFDRKRSKERLLKAFNKKIKNSNKMVRNKVKKVTMKRILRPVERESKPYIRSQKNTIYSSRNTLNKKKNSIEKVNEKKSLDGAMTTDKTEHRSKQHQYQGKQKLMRDIHQSAAGSDKVEQSGIGGIEGIQKSDKRMVKRNKFVVSKTECFSLEHRTVGQEKGKRLKKNRCPSKNLMRHQEAVKTQKNKAKYRIYCSEDQLKSMNKYEPIAEKEMNPRKQTSKNTNNLKVESMEHNGPERKHDIEKHGTRKITSNKKDSGKEIKKISNEYLLERPMSSQCLNSTVSGKEHISPVLSTEKALVHRSSSSKYSLEKQILECKIPNEQFNNVSKSYSADELKDMEGKFDTRSKLFERETRNISRAKIQEILPKINVVVDHSDFGERIMDPDRSILFFNKVSGVQDCSAHKVVAKIKNIFANGQNMSKVNKQQKSEASTMENDEHETNSTQMKFRHFNKFLIAERKSGIADNGKMADINHQGTLRSEIPEGGEELLTRNVKQNQASNIPGKNENITSMKMVQKGNDTPYDKLVVEKKLPVYPPVEVKAPKQAVTKFCYNIQIPPKSIMQVLTQPRSDVTTLTENPRREIISVPKESNPKGRNLKITYIRVNRKPEKFDESFLPALMPDKKGNKTNNEKHDFQMNREQILKMRFQLLKHLREEFEILNDKQIDRLLGSSTEKTDNKSEFKFKLTDNKAIDDDKSPKNNTNMLIKKLSERDRSNEKGEPEKPEGDPKKR